MKEPVFEEALQDSMGYRGRSPRFAFGRFQSPLHNTCPSEPQLLHLFNGVGFHQQQIQPFIQYHVPGPVLSMG